jgi:glycosyltransferase involved in cell wall biosynthesis
LSTPLLSIIIPAHNEETRLPRTLEQVFAFLASQEYSAEVIVVENGSSDRTLEVAQGFASDHANLTVIHSAARGKGLAVRTGMLAASGDYRFMCDADLSMPIEQVNRFLPPALRDFDVAIGSREVKGARRYNEPAHRHLGGRLINLIIRLLILPSLQDTQCGFKCFRADVARDLFAHQLDRYASIELEMRGDSDEPHAALAEHALDTELAIQYRSRLHDRRTINDRRFFPGYKSERPERFGVLAISV